MLTHDFQAGNLSNETTAALKIYCGLNLQVGELVDEHLPQFSVVSRRAHLQRVVQIEIELVPEVTPRRQAVVVDGRTGVSEQLYHVVRRAGARGTVEHARPEGLRDRREGRSWVRGRKWNIFVRSLVAGI